MISINTEVTYKTMDGNEAAANIGYRTNEICAIYPITPASNMGEYADAWAAKGMKNAWGIVPMVVEMQSEAGAVGALHGAIQTGALSTTFTASQGLLLMIPNMFKIAGELSPTVIHVAARSVATQAMSIYCDHSDAMSTRSTGFALLASANVQEAHDMALIAQAASLQSHVPFLHFFDGFRTSHEVSKIEYLSDEQIRAMIDDEWIAEHRARRLSSENPFIRGAVENADIFFQARESVSRYYNATPDIMSELMRKFEKITGRHYEPIEYFGHPEAERIIVLMGSGVGTVYETVAHLVEKGEKVGLLNIRLFRPFSQQYLLKVLPKSCKTLVILDRTKEPGSSGEPLHQELSLPILEAYQSGELKHLPTIVGGRYGISSKEFTPAMVKAIFDEAKKEHPKNHFTIGIVDDVCHTHLSYDAHYDIESDDVVRALFYGLGADGTVGANKNTIKIIGELTDYDVQAYFVYDSKKSGSKTTSHLRFGPRKIRSAYLINQATFIGCHQYQFVEKSNVLELAAPHATFLLNSTYDRTEVWNHLPRVIQQTIIDKQISFYVIDAVRVAKETGMGNRINTIMQTCFFALSNIIPKEKAIEAIKESIRKTYAVKGEEVLKKNFAAVDQSIANLFKVEVPTTVTSQKGIPAAVSDKAPAFVRDVIAKMMIEKGDDLPVSAIPCDGTFPSQTTQWEKRSIASEIPVWNPETCIQCGRCVLTCPHSVIRVKQGTTEALANAPTGFKKAALRGKNAEGKHFILQIHPEDCMGCELCVRACPVKGKALSMEKKEPVLENKKQNVEFFETLPYLEKTEVNTSTLPGLQYVQPMFEFCGACSGCGEAPYVKMLSQLFGDRMIVGTACGCALVYGSMLPTNPWVVNNEGYGPAYSGSLFEDNAEFAFGFALSEEKLKDYAKHLLKKLMPFCQDNFFTEILEAEQETDQAIHLQRKRIIELKSRLQAMKEPEAKILYSIADFLVKHSIWALGGDGWAYDIGFGGLDHVIASNKKINILVLDTEVYSNTGGQASKASSRGAVVKFAMEGKKTAKKDLGLMAMTYGSAYVASISLAANPAQAVKAFKEADAYNGPALIIAYAPCIAHGIDMRTVAEREILAVKSGYWPLYRYNPDRVKEGLNPLQLDCEKPSISLTQFAESENRFRVLERTHPEEAKRLMAEAQKDVDRRRAYYEKLAEGK